MRAILQQACCRFEVDFGDKGKLNALAPRMGNTTVCKCARIGNATISQLRDSAGAHLGLAVPQRNNRVIEAQW
jgi:hypothetical protein